MVKSVDPHALVLGPEEWGWNGYFYSGYDQQWSGQHNDYNPADYPTGKPTAVLITALALEQLHITRRRMANDYSIISLFTVIRRKAMWADTDTDSATELLRNQSTRLFWDPNYVDPSWIDSVIDLIPRMTNWVATNYPGTKIGITEYNWGGETSMNGATAQADILGIFGRLGVDLPHAGLSRPRPLIWP